MDIVVRKPEDFRAQEKEVGQRKSQRCGRITDNVQKNNNQPNLKETYHKSG